MRFSFQELPNEMAIQGKKVSEKYLFEIAIPIDHVRKSAYVI